MPAKSLMIPSLLMALACYFFPSLSAIDASVKPIAPPLPQAVAQRQSLDAEINALDLLIDITQKNADRQRELKKQILEYKSIQGQLLKNDQDKELMFKMVKSAHQLLETIKEDHLLHLFHKEFLSELTTLSQIALKKGIPQP